MRTFLRGKVTLLFMTCAVLLAIPAIVLADNVQNDVVATAGQKIVSVQAGQTTGNVGAPAPPAWMCAATRLSFRPGV